jgi:hypothetical protein
MAMRRRILALGMVATQVLAACGGSAPTADTVGTDLPTNAATESATSAPTDSGALVYDEAAWKNAIPSDGATWTYVSGGVELATRFVASDDTLGEPHSMYEALGYNGKNPVGVRIWLDVSNPWHIVFFGINAYQNSGTLDDPTITYRFAEPVDIAVDMQVGETRSQDYQPTEHISGVGDGAGDATVNYTLLEADASVEVPYGTVTGCYHYEMHNTGVDMQVEVWWKPGLGLVKASEIAGILDIELAAVGQ